MTPFASFVQPGLSPLHAATSRGVASFPRYCDLSLELVLNIYEFYDAATLFQLIRACPVGREAAKKLFCAHGDPWYYVSAQGLVKEAGFSGGTWHCAQFARFVQQIEVGFQFRMEHDFMPFTFLKTYRSFYYPSSDRTIQPASKNPDLLDQVKNFWKTICVHFPAA